MAEAARNALVEVLGADVAEGFPLEEVHKLAQHGYINARRLKISTREGLNRIQLLQACIDEIMARTAGEFFLPLTLESLCPCSVHFHALTFLLNKFSITSLLVPLLKDRTVGSSRDVGGLLDHPAKRRKGEFVIYCSFIMPWLGTYLLLTLAHRPLCLVNWPCSIAVPSSSGDIMDTNERFRKAMEAPLICPISLSQLETMLSHAEDGLIPVTSSFYQEVEQKGLREINFLFEGHGPVAEHMSATLRNLSRVKSGRWIKVLCLHWPCLCDKVLIA